MIFKKEIVEQLSEELTLPFTGKEQDWDIEMANSNRIKEFLQFYQRNNLSRDKKVAIMALILASYEDFLNENDIDIDNRWNEIKLLLEFEKMIFVELIDYWQLNNEVEKENFFRITPLMRNI